MKAFPTNNKNQGTTEIGIPLLIVAILGAIVLSNFWQDLPFWSRVVSMVLIGIFVIGGFILLGQPSGMGNRALEQEIKDLVKKDRTESKKEGED